MASNLKNAQTLSDKNLNFQINKNCCYDSVIANYGLIVTNKRRSRVKRFQEMTLKNQNTYQLSGMINRITMLQFGSGYYSRHHTFKKGDDIYTEVDCLVGKKKMFTYYVLNGKCNFPDNPNNHLEYYKNNFLVCQKNKFNHTRFYGKSDLLIS